MGKGTSKSRMLLLELLLSVFIFSFCVITCARVFFAASTTAQDSQNLTRAVQAAQSAAEAFKATDTLEELAWLLDGTIGQNALMVYYDANWNTQPTGDGGAYALGVSVNQRSDGTATALIDVVDNTNRMPGDRMADIMYTISVSKLQREVSP